MLRREKSERLRLNRNAARGAKALSSPVSEISGTDIPKGQCLGIRSENT